MPGTPEPECFSFAGLHLEERLSGRPGAGADGVFVQRQMRSAVNRDLYKAVGLFTDTIQCAGLSGLHMDTILIRKHSVLGAWLQGGHTLFVASAGKGQRVRRGCPGSAGPD